MSDKVVFETEDGQTLEWTVIEQTMLFGKNYILVTDSVDEEDGDFMILKEESVDGDCISYTDIEDEQELKAVIRVFDELLEDIDLEVE